MSMLDNVSILTFIENHMSCVIMHLCPVSKSIILSLWHIRPKASLVLPRDSRQVDILLSNSSPLALLLIAALCPCSPPRHPHSSTCRVLYGFGL